MRCVSPCPRYGKTIEAKQLDIKIGTEYFGADFFMPLGA